MRSYVSNLQTPRNLSNRAIHKIPIRPKCLRKWRTKKLTLSKPVVSKKSYRSCRKLSHCLQNFSSSELKSKARLMEKHYSINHIRYANEIFDPKIDLIVRGWTWLAFGTLSSYVFQQCWKNSVILSWEFQPSWNCDEFEFTSEF